MHKAELHRTILEGFFKILTHDKRNALYLLYYSAVESILLLSIPLASSFIINSLLAQASLSLIVLGLIVVVILMIVLVLQIIKEYIIEKFQQKIFVSNAIAVGELAEKSRSGTSKERLESSQKFMNYFFDILSVQKIFPLLVLDGAGLLMKITVSLLLLLAFDPLLFGYGVFYFVLFVLVLLLLGTGSFYKAKERSEAKHEAIYYLQHIPNQSDKTKEEILEGLDTHLQEFVHKRQGMFQTIIRQMGWMFFMEGVIISGFLILGGLLVINGKLPVGEFVAAEIIIVTIVYAIRAFVKQLDYIYDMIEGIYKIDKLSHLLGEQKSEH
ncbi:MAG: ABC transporter ATP-binding protein [Helicobacteraceae bacterium]|nr:ABC transporter ATP-binding protein [Helicobacteraceae bacterium]